MLQNKFIVFIFLLLKSFGNDSDLCGDNDAFGSELITPPQISDINIKIGIQIDCLLSLVNITFEIPSNNWVAIVFGSSMSSPNGNPSLIISSGKDGNDPVQCAAYSLTSNSGSGVNSVANTYNTIINTIDNGQRRIVCTQSLSDSSIFSLDTNQVQYGVAWSQDNTLQLGYHFSNRISPFFVDLLSGETFTTSPNKLPYIHGISMFIAWSICAYIGIFSSANRHIFEQKSNWWLFHRLFQTLTLIFFIIGWILMIIYKFKQQRTPLDFLTDPHQGIGFTVILIGILQPFNALFRGTHNKSKRRIIWEYIHKGLGYIALLLAQVAIILGLIKIDEQTIMYIFIGYITILCLIFIIYQFRGKTRAEFILTDNETASEIETSNIESTRLVSKN